VLARTPDTASVQAAALAAGMKTMFESGLELASRGLTSVEEVCVSSRSPGERMNSP